MTPFKFILAATDFSEPANHAVRRAAMLAKQHGARLHILHVVVPTKRGQLRAWFSPAVDLDQKQAEAQDVLRRLADDLTDRHGLTPSIEVRGGEFRDELQRASAGADLLVIGQRRRSALTDMVLGSTAQHFVEHSRRPVLVVKQAPRWAYRRALVPIDFTPASDAAALVAATLASDIDLQFFHAFDSTGETVMREADVSESVIREYLLREEVALKARMRRSMARLGLDSARLSFALGRGSAVRAILRQAQSLNADVLVAAKQRRGRMATTVLGSINRLLVRSRCDMLIVCGGVREPRHPQAVAASRAPSLAVRIGSPSGPRGRPQPVLRGCARSCRQTPSWQASTGRPLRAGG